MTCTRDPKPGDVWEVDGHLHLVACARGWDTLDRDEAHAELVDQDGTDAEWWVVVPSDARFIYNAFDLIYTFGEGELVLLSFRLGDRSCEIEPLDDGLVRWVTHVEGTHVTTGTAPTVAAAIAAALEVRE